MKKMTEVKTYLIDQICDECKEGLMRPKQILMCDPPKWVHKCTECNETKSFSVKYPYPTYV